ncbi:hypothetical protein [Hazenella coriacea]|uniref:Uncharacterized protein n=1 Tax=Hazenella coriacea TaxID=1179467 RepID=A0A4R3L7F8_9BACL|nr:hypothetical protein [Hazenella coriacea]TCS94965.1 hypothetical protein EDD58_103390 [Hazenella coriacea]
MRTNIKWSLFSLVVGTLSFGIIVVLWLSQKVSANQFFAFTFLSLLILSFSSASLIRKKNISNERTYELYNDPLVKESVLPSIWLQMLNHKDEGEKLMWGARLLGIGCMIGFICFIEDFVRWIDSIYPHHKFAPDVDAAIITTMGSTFTLGLTLIVTFYFNRQTQLAMIEQSHANLKERVIEKRMILYPEVEQLIEDLGILYPDFLHTDDWNDTVSHLDQLYQENKYYLSKSLRVYIQNFGFCES